VVFIISSLTFIFKYFFLFINLQMYYETNQFIRTSHNYIKYIKTVVR